MYFNKLAQGKIFKSISRRNFIKTTLITVLSSLTIYTISPVSVTLASGRDGDVKIMNVTLGLEHQAIAAYNAGAGTKLLSDPVLELAVKFLKQHEQYRDALAATIRKFAGRPVEPPAKYDVAAIAKGVGVTELHVERDIVRLWARLEEQATKAYLASIPSIESKDVIKAIAAIAADTAQRTAILRNALGEDPTSKAYLGF